MRYVGQKEPSKEDLKSHGRTATHTCHPSESCALLELHFSPFAISYSTLAQWTPRGNGQLSLIWILNPFYSEIVFWNYFTTAWRQIFRNDKDKSFHFFGAHLFFPISCNSSVCSGIAVVLIELGLTQFNPRKITESEASIFPSRNCIWTVQIWDSCPNQIDYWWWWLAKYTKFANHSDESIREEEEVHSHWLKEGGETFRLI